MAAATLENCILQHFHRLYDSRLTEIANRTSESK